MGVKRATYVETHAGWRAFFLCVLVAAVLGFGFRLVFSPARLKAWVTRALDRQKAAMAHPFALSFGDAALRLSDSSGTWPQLAVVVSDVRVAPNPECHPEASVFIGELRLPFRVRDLLAGRAAVGIVGARDLVVDLDGLRAHCDPASSAAHATPDTQEAGGSPAANAGLNARAHAETAQKLDAPAMAHPNAQAGRAAAVAQWWTPEQFEAVHGFVEGFEFSRATLQFETKTKEIYLDSFSARLTGDRDVELRTEVRIPPQVAFGEPIPALKIEGHATSSQANLVVHARVSEGSMQTTATLTPAQDQQLEMEATMSVKSLPLSMFSPLMRKSGLVDAKFQPKFLWLDCEAKIAGPFQGLFQKSPLTIRACRIEGDGTDIRLEEATRTPKGDWKPFDVKVQSLNLAKLFETAGVKGPEGVASDFGKLSGDIHVESDHVADFRGQLRNARLQFSNRKVRAPQVIDSADVEIKIGTDRLTASLAHVALQNGVFSGRANLELDRSLSKGSAQLDIEKLEFDPAVQTVLVGGTLGTVEGTLRAKIDEARVKDFEARLQVNETTSADFEFAKLLVKAGRQGEEPPRIAIDAPSLELKQGLRKAIEPAFYGHELKDLKLDQPHAELLVLGGGEIEWTKAKASLERGQIQLVSSGSMNRDRIVDGSLTIHYPKIKNLKWSLKGPLESPTLKGVSAEITQLKARAEVNDKVLGLQ